MDNDKPWKLNDKQREEYEKKCVEVLNESEQFQLYNMYVADLRKGFIEVINFVNNKINNLIEQGKISDFIEIRARIKAAQSAIKNDSLKALDDVFGMEIITATEDEIETILNHLKPYIAITKSKEHDKSNGYKAKHSCGYFKKGKLHHLESENDADKTPIIEIQLKTSEVHILSNGGRADHTTYKGEDKAEIQRKFENGEFSIYTNIPTMWISKDGKMVLLSPEDTLKKIYPFLNTKKKGSR